MDFLFNFGKAFVAMLICVSMFSTAAIADEYGTATFTPEQFVEYEQQLNAILKTRRDEEKEFVSQVVRQVRLGKIPSKLVSTSYGWVRNKRPNTNYPFIYFEKVLRLQAKTVKLDKEIPRFDLTIYRSAGQATGRRTYSAGQRTEAQRQVKPSLGRR